MNYTLNQNGKELGSFSASEIQAMIGSGEVLPHDLIWKQGMAEWLPISAVIPPPLPERFFVVPGMPPIPPIPTDLKVVLPHLPALIAPPRPNDAIVALPPALGNGHKHSSKWLPILGIGSFCLIAGAVVGKYLSGSAPLKSTDGSVANQSAEFKAAKRSDYGNTKDGKSVNKGTGVTTGKPERAGMVDGSSQKRGEILSVNGGPNVVKTTIGEGFKLGEFSYKITSAVKTSIIGNSDFEGAVLDGLLNHELKKFGMDGALKPAADQPSYLVIRYVIKNESLVAEMVSTADFEIEDSKGRKFQTSNKATTELVLKQGADIGFVTLQPGIGTAGVQAFELPNEAFEDELTLIVPQKGFRSSGKASVSLGVLAKNGASTPQSVDKSSNLNPAQPDVRKSGQKSVLKPRISSETARQNYILSLAEQRHHYARSDMTKAWQSIDAEICLHPAPADADAKDYSRMLVGKWSSPRHSYIYRSDGSWSMLPDEPESTKGHWHIEGNKYFPQAISKKPSVLPYTIILLNDKVFIYSETGRVYYMSRIE